MGKVRESGLVRAQAGYQAERWASVTARNLDELTVEAQHRMHEVDVPIDSEPEPMPGPRYTAPTLPPPELGFDVAKWRTMSRPERRAVLRYAKKQARGT